MTIQEFATNHYGEVTNMVLCEAGIRCIRSYRAMFQSSPPKKSEGLYEVFDYPPNFEDRMKIIFKRMVKDKLIVPVSKPEKKKRKRIVKPIISSNG